MCPRCGEAHIDLYIPLDPKYFPEFKYVTQGLVKDLFLKKKKQQELDRKLESVLEKYMRFKHPYFVNYLHIARGGSGDIEGDSSSKFTYSRLTLFHHVLTRLGFNELQEYPNLTKKLVLSTQIA